MVSNWDYFEKMTVVIGFIGSVISFFTFLIALKVRKKIIYVLDKIEFKENSEILLGEIDGFIAILKTNENKSIKNLHTQIIEFIASTDARYSFFNSEISRTLKKIDKLNTEKIVDNKDKILKLFAKLKSLLQKEVNL